MLLHSFTILYSIIDRSTKNADKVGALKCYLESASTLDSAWAIFLLSGHKLQRTVSGAVLREWAGAASELPAWLIEESYKSAGDLAEALSLVIAEHAESADLSISKLVELHVKPLERLTLSEKQIHIELSWKSLATPIRTIFNKLLLGTFRSPVSAECVAQAVAELSSSSVDLIYARLSSDWHPDEKSMTMLTVPEGVGDEPVPVLEIALEPPEASEIIEQVSEDHRLIAVLIYVQQARGTADAEYTFGVWDAGKLVPVVKTAEGLRTADRAKIDRHTRLNTLERFGPVRTVAPTLVFELTYRSVSLSSRTKSGIALEAARIVRLLPDQLAEHADSLASVKANLSEPA